MKYSLIIIGVITILFRQLGLKNIPEDLLDLLQIKFHTKASMIIQHYMLHCNTKSYRFRHKTNKFFLKSSTDFGVGEFVLCHQYLPGKAMHS